ncbi:MAG: tryptophan-rich sensory protein [Chitinophagaceae bacterium]|jgi:hypothetical protein|nr:tryptophan-rich sensory protein [Chitinophagaceae bacterium]
MQKALSVGNIIALIITIVINYFSNTGIFNGNTMSTVSATYSNYFTPAGYAFSIWGLIYVGLFAFIIYHSTVVFKSGNTKNVALNVGWWFVISCVANCLWIFSWLYEYTGLSVIIMMVLLFSLIMIILKTRMELDDLPKNQILFVWWPFSLYSGWITVALMANIAAYLTKISWDGLGIPGDYWTVIMIITAGLVHLFMILKRNMREFALAGVWALIAIAVANRGNNTMIVQVAIAVSVLLFISVAIHAYINRKSLPWLPMKN